MQREEEFPHQIYLLVGKLQLSLNPTTLLWILKWFLKFLLHFKQKITLHSVFYRLFEIIILINDRFSKYTEEMRFTSEEDEIVGRSLRGRRRTAVGRSLRGCRRTTVGRSLQVVGSCWKVVGRHLHGSSWKIVGLHGSWVTVRKRRWARLWSQTVKFVWLWSRTVETFCGGNQT